MSQHTILSLQGCKRVQHLCKIAKCTWEQMCKWPAWLISFPKFWFFTRYQTPNTPWKEVHFVVLLPKPKGKNTLALEIAVAMFLFGCALPRFILAPVLVSKQQTLNPKSRVGYLGVHLYQHNACISRIDASVGTAKVHQSIGILIALDRSWKNAFVHTQESICK